MEIKNISFLLTLLLFIVENASTQNIKVNDTDFSKGRLGNIQTINIDDVAKFHGHKCDGLVEAFLALELALNEIYPNGIVDRTNTRVISKSSPCMADVAIYLTGGRYQFNTFYIDNEIDGLFIVEKIDIEEKILVQRKENVKPQKIDELGKVAIQKKLNSCQLNKLKALEEEYSEKLLKGISSDFFDLKKVKNLEWHPNMKNDYIKTDIINKNQSKCEH